MWSWTFWSTARGTCGGDRIDLSKVLKWKAVVLKLVKARLMQMLMLTLEMEMALRKTMEVEKIIP